MQQAAPGASTSVPAGVLDVAQPHFEADLEINDFPQHARWKARSRLPDGGSCLVTGARVVLGSLSEATPVTISVMQLLQLHAILCPDTHGC